MKKATFAFMMLIFFTLTSLSLSAQPGTENYVLVNMQMLKTKWPENGSIKERDSLVAVYNNNVVKKNEYILSHKEYTHWFTGNNRDYMVIEEYKDFDSMEKSFERNTELEKLAWPDEKKAKEFFDKMGGYFENWHGDALYRTNPALTK